MDQTQPILRSGTRESTAACAWCPAWVETLYLTIFVLALVLLAGIAGGDPPVSRVHNPVALAGVGADSAGIDRRMAADLNALGESRQKELYLDCARESSRQRMDLDQAASCLVVADMLLANSFAGDFARMIEWWHSQRDLDY